MTLKNRRYIKWLAAILVFASATLLFVWRLLPFTAYDMRRCVVSVEHGYCYALASADSTIMYFAGLTPDTLFISPSDTAVTVSEYAAGCWINAEPLLPSCEGRIASYFDAADSCLYDTAVVRRLVNDELAAYQNRIEHLKHSRREIKYYIDTHGVSDEGFERVVAFYSTINAEDVRLRRIAAMLSKAAAAASLKVSKIESYHVRYKDAAGKEVRTECRLIKPRGECGATLLQLPGAVTPDGVRAAATWHLLPFRPLQLRDTVYVMGTTYIDDSEIARGSFGLVPEYLLGDSTMMFPRTSISRGAPVFTRDGFFIGILGRDRVIRRRIIRKSL